MNAFALAGPALTGSSRPLDFDRLFAAEERHFWFRARNRVLAGVIADLVAQLPPGYRVLEVGCGTGNVLRILEQVCVHGEVIGLDLFAEGLQFARWRTACRLVQADIHQMPFRRPFQLIGMFDVLEHLPDDRRILRDLWDALVPGGWLLLTVPAHRRLWSYADEYAGHQRRYAVGELTETLSASGFEVEYVTQFMLALFPLMWLGRRLAGRRPGLAEDQREKSRELFLRELRIVPILNGLLRRCLEWEAPLIRRRFRLPLGTSLLAIARKPPVPRAPAA